MNQPSWPTDVYINKENEATYNTLFRQISLATVITMSLLMKYR